MDILSAYQPLKILVHIFCFVPQLSEQEKDMMEAYSVWKPCNIRGSGERSTDRFPFDELKVCLYRMLADPLPNM
jgi:hypothetical protein